MSGWSNQPHATLRILFLCFLLEDICTYYSIIGILIIGISIIGIFNNFKMFISEKNIYLQFNYVLKPKFELLTNSMTLHISA